MKTLYTIILYITLIPQVNAQYFEQAIREGNKGDDAWLGMTSDNFGNIYVIGQVSYTTTFGQNNYSQVLENGGVFLAKYDPDLNLILIKKLSYWPTAITVDAIGHIYITGQDCRDGFSSPDPYKSCLDLIISKYDTNGNLLWSRKEGGDYEDAGQSIVVDKLGNCYVGGYFYFSSVFNGTDTIKYVSGTIGRFFLASFDSNGNYRWVKAEDHGFGKIYITKNEEIILPTNKGFAKYLPDGTKVWTNDVRMGDINVRSTAMDKNDNIYITGEFINTCDFGGGSVTSNFWDMFIAKYDNQGNFINVTIHGGPGTQGASSILITENGELFVSGGFGSEITFQNSQGSTQLMNKNTQGTVNDWFIGHFNESLEFIYAVQGDPEQLGGAGNILFNPINQKIYAGGSFESSMFLPSEKGSIILEAITTQSSMMRDLFISVFNPKLNITNTNNETTIPDLTVYPNPTENTLHLVYTAAGKEDITLNLMSYLGQKVFTKKYFDTSQINDIIDLSSYAKGVYFLEIIGGERRQTKKLILN
jgi:hypothetical protein